MTPSEEGQVSGAGLGPAPGASRLLFRGLGVLAAVLLFAMMSLTFVDVWGRYLFSAPLPGGFEVTELLLACLIFAGLPLVTASKEHVTVDLFDHFLPASLRLWRDALVSFLCAGMSAVVTWKLWDKAGEALDYGDTTAALQLPIAPVTFFMTAMMALVSVILLLLALIQLPLRRN